MDGGPFADFVNPKDMASFVPVTETDLFLFLAPWQDTSG
jgi:hypothetical protein